MKLSLIRESEAFRLKADEAASFAGTAKPFRIDGPLHLVRLVQRDRSKVGNYWFEWRVFRGLLLQAERELIRQNAANKEKFVRPIKELAGNYIRHCFRNDLAISKDWTADFDQYVELRPEARDSMVAWVGSIRSQPYWSKPDPGKPDYAEKKAAHDLAESAGVRLIASEKQYVVHFDFPANRALRVSDPHDF